MTNHLCLFCSSFKSRYFRFLLIVAVSKLLLASSRRRSSGEMKMEILRLFMA